MATIHQFTPRAKSADEAPVIHAEPAQVQELVAGTYLRLLNLRTDPKYSDLVGFLLGLNKRFQELCGTPEHNYLVDGIRYELSCDDEAQTQTLEIHGPAPEEKKYMRYVQVVVSQLDQISSVGSPYTAKMCLDKMEELLHALTARLPEQFTKEPPAHVVVPFDIVQYLIQYQGCKVVSYYMADNPAPVHDKSPFINLQSETTFKQYRVSVNFNALALIFNRDERPF